MSGRVRLLAALVAALALAVVTGGPVLAASRVPTQTDTTAPADPEAEGDPEAEEDPAEVDPFDRLASCVGAEGRLLVVLLVDESASLRQTDPDDQRVVAARAALRSIDLLRGTDAAGDSVAIDVLVSTFSFDFAAVDDWTSLTVQPPAAPGFPRPAGRTARPCGAGTPPRPCRARTPAGRPRAVARPRRRDRRRCSGGRGGRRSWRTRGWSGRARRSRSRA